MYHGVLLAFWRYVLRWDSSVDLAMTRTGRPGFDSRQGQEIFLLHSVQTGSGANPDSYPMGAGALSPGVKWPRREADHSPPTSAAVNNDGAMLPLPHTSSWHFTLSFTLAPTQFYLGDCLHKLDEFNSNR
jgi:hypothetical protein